MRPELKESQFRIAEFCPHFKKMWSKFGSNMDKPKFWVKNVIKTFT